MDLKPTVIVLVMLYELYLKLRIIFWMNGEVNDKFEHINVLIWLIVICARYLSILGLTYY